MKKLLLCILSLLGVLSLASCGKDEEEPGEKDKKTVIQYCGWNLGTEAENNLTRRLIQKFNDTSKTIIIEPVVPQGTYDEFLNTLAAGGALPDVFLVNSVPAAVTNKLAGDITAETTADVEWKDVESSLREAVTYNGSVYAIPAAQNYLGLFANYDLIDDYATSGQDSSKVFEAGKFTSDQFLSTVKQVKSINKTDGTGVIGMSSAGDFINWLPSSMDTTGKTKHFVWNGEKFDLTGSLMKDALAKIQEIGSSTGQYVFDSIPDKDANDVDLKSAIFGATDQMQVFQNGQMGFIQSGSWETMANVDFDYKFVAYPDAKVISTGDFMCISKSSANKAAALEVAKYLTYGSEGIKARYDIIAANPNDKLSVNGLPVNTNTELTAKWFESIKLKGVKEVYEKVSSGEIEVIVEGNKTVPGFISARFEFNTGVVIVGVKEGNQLKIGDLIWEACRGKISLNDYNTHMTQALANRINKEITDAFTAMGLSK